MKHDPSLTLQVQTIQKPMDFPFPLLSLIIILSAITTVLLHHLRRAHHRLPPGNYGYPLIGETLRLISAYKSDNPEPFIDDRVSRFGPLFTTHIFGEPTVFTADPEVNRFVLQNEGRLFECSYPASIANLLGKHSLLLTKGTLHKRMHCLTMKFGNSSIIRDHLLFDIDRLIRFFMDSWTVPAPVFLMEEAKKITFALTVKNLMSFDPCDWTEMLRKEYQLVINGFFTIPLPFFSTTYNQAIKARTKVAEALTLVVRQRRSAIERGERNKDILAALLDEEAGGERFSDEVVVDFLLSLLVAGYETTSTVITLAVKFLTETPLALAKLKEEQESIRAKKGKSETLDWSDYKSTTFTQCVVNETLRVANIIGGVFRQTISDVNIGGYTIPKGWKVFASFRAIHMNDKNFKDARSFNPWRWQSENGETCPASAFTPFGGGPRLCPGQELTRVTLSVFLYHFVTKFSWEPAEQDKLVYFPTTRTQKRYPIYVQRRNASYMTQEE